MGPHRSADLRVPMQPPELEVTDDLSIEVSSDVMTDAALRKSQLLLDQLMSTGLFDEDGPVMSHTLSHSSSTAEIEDQYVMGSDLDASVPSTSSPFAKPATAEVPVEFLKMLAEMWQQIKDGQQAAEHASTAALPSMGKLPLASELSPGGSTLVPSSAPSLTSTMTSLCSRGCSVATTSAVDSPSPTGMSTRMTAEDKAQLIKELREALCTSLPSKGASVARGQQLSLSRSAALLTHIQGTPIAACPLVPQQPCVARGVASAPHPLASPRAASRGPGLVATSPRAVSPSRALSHPAVPHGRRMSWQKVAVTSIHHVLTPC